MRPQLGNRHTDTRQTDMRQRDPQREIQAFIYIYIVGYIRQSRLFLASYNKARGHDETPARQQNHRHEVMRPQVTDLQSQKVIVVQYPEQKRRGSGYLADGYFNIARQITSFIAIHIQSLSLPNTCYKKRKQERQNVLKGQKVRNISTEEGGSQLATSQLGRSLNFVAILSQKSLLTKHMP